MWCLQLKSFQCAANVSQKIEPGKSHNCTKSAFQSNLTGIVKKKSVNSKGKVSCAIIKSVANDQNVSLRGGNVNLLSGSKILPVLIGTKKVAPKPARFSHANLMRMQTAHNLSDTTLK